MLMHGAGRAWHPDNFGRGWRLPCATLFCPSLLLAMFLLFFFALSFSSLCIYVCLTLAFVV